MSLPEMHFKQQEKLENANHIVRFISDALASWDTQRMDIIEQDLIVVGNLLYESHKAIKEVETYLATTLPTQIT